MQHLGIYSGTFDPVHIGHVAFADEAQRVCGLERVIFMPEEQPRGKVGVAPIQERIGLLEAGLQASRHGIYRARHPRFTIQETIAELEQYYPDVKLSFLIGSDIVSSLPSWPDIGRLVADHALIVGMRADHQPDEVDTVLSRLGARYTIVATPHAHVSSRQMREKS